MLKAATSLSPSLSLTHIFNLPIQYCTFPRKMQKAKVTVIFKAWDKNELSNYRPISVLPIFSKAVDKIIYFQLSKFCEKYRISSFSPYGFRKDCSTERALLHQKKIIFINTKARRLTLGIFLGFSKALDIINHESLLEKLNLYGIRGVPLTLHASYHICRLQTIRIDGGSSDLRQVKARVPQRSILGLL